MRFFYNNLVDGVVTMTPTSEVATLPVENIANEARTLPWRTGTSTATERVVIDLGAAAAATSIILLDHTLTAGDSAITLEAHTSDAWGAPSFTTTLTYAADIIVKVFSSQSFRYWRLSFTKSSAGEPRDIGRVFLGVYYETAEQPDYDGYKDELVDLSESEDTPSGQTYTDLRDKFRIFTCDFSRISQTEIVYVRAFADYVGTSVSFFQQVDPNGSAPLNECVYVKLRKNIKPDVAGMDADLTWNFSVESKEQL